MRWKKKNKNKPQEGDRRIIKKFLFWPHTLAGETRWLERAKVKQKYLNSPSPGDMSGWWNDIAWETN